MCDFEVVDAVAESPAEGADCDDYLEMAPADKKKPSWAPYWFILRGSSLFYYKNELDAKAKGVVQLSGASVEQHGDVVVVRAASGGGKKGDAASAWQLKASTEEKAQRWAQQLTAARERSPREMPDRDALARVVKRRSVAYRAKKALGSKIAGSRLGAGTVSAFNELADRLVSSISFLVTAESDKRKAAWVTKGTAKLVVKFFIELDRGTIKNDQLMAVDAPLRAAFNTFEQLFRNYKRVPVENMRDLFVKADQNLNEAGRMLRELIRPYIRAKNMLMMQSIQEYMNSAQFWMHIWNMPDPEHKIENALFNVTSAMTRYTQVEVHTAQSRLC